MSDQPSGIPKVSVTAGKKQENPPPVVKARRAGKVGQTLESIADQYKAANPGMSAHWVYAPAHRPELSNVMSRRAEGYRPVLARDIGDLDGFDPDDPVRVGDLILMGIEESIRAGLAAEKSERAKEQIRSVETEYYESIEGVDQREEGVPRMRPTGRSVIEERDHEYDVHQREEE